MDTLGSDLEFTLSLGILRLFDYSFVKYACAHPQTREWEDKDWMDDENRENHKAVVDLFRYAVYLFGPEVDNPAIKEELQTTVTKYNERVAYSNTRAYDYRRLYPLNIYVSRIDNYYSEFAEKTIVADIFENDKDLTNFENRERGYYKKFVEALKEIEDICLKYSEDKPSVEARISKYAEERKASIPATISKTFSHKAEDEERFRAYNEKRSAEIKAESEIRMAEMTRRMAALKAGIDPDTGKPFGEEDDSSGSSQSTGSAGTSGSSSGSGYRPSSGGGCLGMFLGLTVGAGLFAALIYWLSTIL